jgi:phosphoglycolate phosphatase
MVGDSKADVAAGRAAGMRTIGVTWGLDPASLRHEPADQTIEDIRSLPLALGDPPSQASVLP